MGEQLVERQSEEVTFNLGVLNPLLSYCARSSFLGTSGNVFLLTGGQGKGAEDTRPREEKEKGYKNLQLWLKDSPFLC